MQEQAKFWLVDDFEHMEMLRATYITHAYSPHTHDEYAIGILERGAEGFDYRHRHWVAPGGTIVIINPGEVHTGHAADERGWTYRMLYPSVSLMRWLLRDTLTYPDEMPIFSRAIIHDPVLLRRIRTMHQTLELSVDPLERETAFVTVMTALVQQYADIHPGPVLATANRRSMETARDYLHAHYAQPISLDDLARVTHLSPYHLSRSFKTAYGLPPHTYLMQVRVNRAKTLLTRGMPIAEVALMTGFTDQSHLTRRFKRVVGVPPGRYIA